MKLFNLIKRAIWEWDAKRAHGMALTYHWCNTDDPHRFVAYTHEMRRRYGKKGLYPRSRIIEGDQ